MRHAPDLAVSRVQVWLHAQARLHGEAARPLSAAERTTYAAFFPAALLRQAGVCIAPRMEPVPADPATRALGLRRLVVPADVQAITFDHTIVLFRRQMPAPEDIDSLLFHELVHVCQYRVLGIDRFVELYLRDWRRRFDYEAIALERQAFALEKRYRSRSASTFPVLPLVRRLAAGN